MERLARLALKIVKKLIPYKPVHDRLYDYLVSSSLREPDVLRQLREETAQLSMGMMQIDPDEGALFTLLVQLLQAKKVLEIGVFTGYSSLCTALALPPDGKLIACDVDEDFTAIARRYWDKAGIAHKIDLRLAPAIETLNQLLADGQANTFDFAFIDADKANYDNYYERSLQLVRPGGLIAVDNVFWGGRVVDQHIQDTDTIAIRDLNEKLHHDERVTLCMLPVADGVSLALKR